MAGNKKILSDFKALKGQVSFTEGPACRKDISSPVPAKPVRTVREDVLKTGQSVVLMDSSLRGKIVSIGRNVRIELEDGLVIEAAYGEFAVTDQSEITCLKETRGRLKKTAVAAGPSRSGAAVPMTVDLHIEAIPGGRAIPEGQQLQFQMETFRKVIRENLPHKGLKITFIHGTGDGILKSAIRKELDEVLALRCSYSIGDPAITVVQIR